MSEHRCPKCGDVEWDSCGESECPMVLTHTIRSAVVDSAPLLMEAMRLRQLVVGAQWDIGEANGERICATVEAVDGPAVSLRVTAPSSAPEVCFSLSPSH